MKTARRRLILTLIFVAIVAVVITVSVFICLFLIRREIHDEVAETLADVAEQNAITIERKIDETKELVLGVAEELHDMPGDMRDNIVSFLPYVKARGLIRIAYCDEEGYAYGTDGAAEDNKISYREFFQRGMQGKWTITEILYDALSDEHKPINIISAPMYDSNGKIDGVVGVTYSAEKFNNELYFRSFDGSGFGCALNSNGEIVVDMHNEHIGKSLLGEVLVEDERNADIIGKLTVSVAGGQNCSGTLYLEGQECNFYGRPLSLLDGDVNWYIIAMVPSAYLDRRVAPVDRYVIILIVIEFFIIIGSTLGFFLMTRGQRRMVNKLAYVDQLTGGNNLAMFCKLVSEGKTVNGAFISVDIVDFRTVNVAVGLEKGNDVLIELYRLLESSLVEEECVAHTSRDNFVMFLHDSDSQKIVSRIQALDRAMAGLSERLNVPPLRARFGIYCSDNRTDPNECYTRACQASEVVRRNKDMLYSFYRSDLNRRYMLNRELLDSFDYAIEHHEFELRYQPKFSVSTQLPVSSEALVRWVRDGENVSPGIFIPLFEENGLIARLDEYIFRMVCAQQRTWLDEGRRILPVSVNLSRASLTFPNIVNKYMGIMREYELDTELVQLEITESAIEGKVDVLNRIQDFHDEGFKILVDDFGSGYSSLALLSSDCFDTLKIDKSLIDNIGDKKGEMLLIHVLGMAKSLGLYVTAEGVEEENQFDFLKNISCDDIQGYYFSKPLKQKEFEAMLATA